MKSTSRVIVIAGEYPPVRGGVGRYTADLCAWIARFHPVTLELWGAQIEPLPDSLPNVEVYDFQTQEVSRLWDRLVETCEASAPKAILLGHIHLLRLQPVWRLRAKGIPLYVPVYGTDVSARQGKVMWVYRWLSMLSGVRVLPISLSTEKIFKRKFPLIKRSLVYPGVRFDPARIIPGPELRKGILSVGRLVERKGFDRLLRAVALLHQKGCYVSVTLCGDGPEKERVESTIADLGLKKYVQLLTDQSDQQIQQHQDRHRVFCLLPRLLEDGDVEGFGIVFLEAAAAGLPSVAGATGGVVDAVQQGETGWLVNPDHTQEIADRLEELLTNSCEWMRMSEQARRFASEMDFIHRNLSQTIPGLGTG